ncbi:hypothetical protein ACFO25_00845 [Paenactinomyces guangxiensis]|uniref:Uncharacterized protein n=1 Tax=Paenactinomyces guangxiensis TaxID=1490290 RepID=A0A7W1WSL5_9BACL|nr:hypothetical protein [Paenactinomyces guangxiensis]MBA4495310.1 hypothetical protein [Paenactinomyces guangxiensis]MBH8592568.1 hypothetical protein [Paenactinomyces guangxiensis]
MKRYAALFITLALVFAILPFSAPVASAEENKTEVKVDLSLDLFKLTGVCQVGNDTVKLRVKSLFKSDVDVTLTRESDGKEVKVTAKANASTNVKLPLGSKDDVWKLTVPGVEGFLTVNLGEIKSCKDKPGDDKPGDKPGNGDKPGDKPGEEPGDNPGEEPGDNPGDQPQPCKEPSEDDFREINVDLKQEGNKVKVTAKLPGKEAEGTWYIVAGGIESEVPEVTHKAEGVKGTTFTYEFDVNKLPAGENGLIVAFEGTIDGQNCSYGVGYVDFTVDEDKVQNPANPKPNPGKGKQDLDKIKGGKLPKTATTYPTGALAGLLLLIVGVGMLKFRRA